MNNKIENRSHPTLIYRVARKSLHTRHVLFERVKGLLRHSVLSRNFPEGTEENQETSQYGIQISVTKLANQSMEEFIRKLLQADVINKYQ